LLEHGDLEAKDELYSVVFNDFVERISDKKVLLDHIFISNKLDSCIVNVGIAHDVAWKYNSSSATTESGRDARVSDHVPVFGDFRI
jgi:exonuclease III